MHAALWAALLCAAADPSALRPGAGGPPPPLPAPGAGQVAAGPAAKPKKGSNKPRLTGVLNLNRATEAELRLLPGIGKRRAELIVERRGKKPFASVEEVGRIKGLRALVQRLRARLTVQGDTTLRPLAP